MQYREEHKQANAYKQELLDGLDRVIAQRQQEAAATRAAYVKDLFADPERYRHDFKAMLGWPLVDHTASAPPKVRMTTLSKEKGYTLCRAQIEVIKGLTMTGLLFKLDGDEARPLVIVQHGGLGSPEFISGVHGGTANYNDMLQRTIRQGVHAFAPQLLMWADDYEVPFSRTEIDAKLKRVGSSITAIEIYGIMRALDYFETQDYVTVFGMLGLSYGGLYSLVTPAAEPRILASIACSFFGQRDRHFTGDWTWFRSAQQFDDAEIACLIYPRKLWIEMGDEDWLYKNTGTEEAVAELRRLCKEVGTDWVDYKVFHGVHEFSWDDKPIEDLVAHLRACEKA